MVVVRHASHTKILCDVISRSPCMIGARDRQQSAGWSVLHVDDGNFTKLAFLPPIRCNKVTFAVAADAVGWRRSGRPRPAERSLCRNYCRCCSWPTQWLTDPRSDSRWTSTSCASANTYLYYRRLFWFIRLTSDAH